MTRKNESKSYTDKSGKFAPGNPGKPKGARHKTTLAVEGLLEGQADALTQKAVDNLGKEPSKEPGQSKSVDLESVKNPIPKFVENEGGELAFQVSSVKAHISLFGGQSDEFARVMTVNCGNISGFAEGCEDDKNAALAIVSEIAPADGIEGMLAVQMASVHIAMMRHSRMMASADTLQRLDMQEKIFNKLARTFTTQMEALRKHRHGGQQKMTVEHVTVQDGGQAIVGTVSKGGT